MLFHSWEFLLGFLPVLLILWLAGIRNNLVLLLASAFFYAWWEPKDLLLLTGSVTLNFWLIRRLQVSSSRNLLILGIILNLLPLFWFKYSSFAASVLEGWIALPHSNRGLPLAISFFTFQQIACLVDSYYGKLQRQNWRDYSLFVVFFPQLIAGPIVHQSQVMEDLKKSRKSLNWEEMKEGWLLFLIGLMKKVLIADTLAEHANIFYASQSSYGATDAWMGTLAYTFQLYFDFSGYADMAIGLGLLFGVRLPDNFSAPYRSRNIQEFWKRWHITLGAWLRDYIYIPLGGSKSGLNRTLLSLFATFFIGGVWHGAGWTFLCWGVWHGIGMILHRLAESFRVTFPWFIAAPMTFIFVHLGWVLFRSESLMQAGEIFQALWMKPGKLQVLDGDLSQILLGCFLVCLFAPKSGALVEKIQKIQGYWFLFVVFLLIMLTASRLDQQAVFLYFQF